MSCKSVIYFEVSDETMTQRLINRGKTSGRIDDNIETIKNRLETFHNQTKPVIDYYEKQNKVRKIMSEKTPDLIFKEVKLILADLEKGKNFYFF